MHSSRHPNQVENLIDHKAADDHSFQSSFARPDLERGKPVAEKVLLIELLRE